MTIYVRKKTFKEKLKDNRPAPSNNKYQWVTGIRQLDKNNKIGLSDCNDSHNLLAIVASNCNSKCTLHTELKKENTKGKGRHGKKKTQSSKRNLLMHATIHTSTYEDERSRKKEIYIYIDTMGAWN